LSQPAPDPGSGGITISLPTVDWANLIPQLVGYFFQAIATYFNDTMHSVFDGMWGSGANVLGQTDLAMTWSFGPVQEQILGLQTAARAILLFALILLGLRGMLSGIIPRQSNMVGEFINGVLFAVILVAGFPLVIPELIRMTNTAATAVGTADLSAYMSSGGANNPLVQAVLFIVLVFFAVRLLIKAVWRIGFLAVLLPLGMAACALYAIPQMRWMLGWWARLWGGMLLAQIPSVMALTIGAQLFAHGSGLGAFVYSIAFLQLATDLYSLIPLGRIDSSSVPWAAGGARIPGLVSGPVGMAAGAGLTVASAVLHTGTAPASAAPTYGYQ
jgi:hypothetical protein